MNCKPFFLTLVWLSCIVGCEQQNERPKHWRSSTPAEQSMDAEVLDSAFIIAEQAGFVDGLLVIRNDFLVAEDYYNGYNPTRPHIIMSVSKSFLSAITGVALQRGYIDSLGEKVMDYFPEYGYEGIDSRKYQISIRHLLTMRMGIRDESDDNYGVYWSLYNSSNWIKATIESPLISDPGERMQYNTFQTHLLSAIITKATGRSTLEFATESLFDSMKIDVDAWERDPQGYYFGGNGMYFTPQEMAVLGCVYLHQGKFEGIQVVPETWVDLTLSPSTDFAHPNAWGALRNYNYAYLWWLGEIGGESLFMGYGYGGQFVIVFPELNLIVVSTANHWVDPNTSTNQEWAIFSLIEKYILPSITDVTDMNISKEVFK